MPVINVANTAQTTFVRDVWRPGLLCLIPELLTRVHPAEVNGMRINKQSDDRGSCLQQWGQIDEL
ncbi:MAG: hypothetical protein MK082_01925 [Phycisphaerales bacterium]|nr:hypothetical protein [Phycisphaerales bacterium]